MFDQAIKAALDELDDEAKCSPLHYAAKYVHENCVETLLNYGANPLIKAQVLIMA